MSVSLQLKEGLNKNHGLYISSKYANFTQQELDNIFKEILEQFPKTGYKGMIGYLMAKGHRVQEKKYKKQCEGLTQSV